jgi:hypothetical protein
VHTGTADSGHYFSYIKADTNETQNNWFEFNDSEVLEFSIDRLEGECFGGSTTQHEYNLSSHSFMSTEVVNPKSAYMLIYSKVNKKYSATVESKPCTDMEPINSKIINENADHSLAVRMLSFHQLNFYKDLMDISMKNYISEGDVGSLKSGFLTLLEFIFKYVARSAYSDLLIQFGELFTKYFSRAIQISNNLNNSSN